ncbi:uncharacterized protein A4U43_C02F16740 [Asparagus officinalis]|uniref:Uncharacterized protein n=1 Tax=Asparagus officinalis TaxID=4686 RepID=A0A5P1FNM7_ASPOF|nr:uncharacterized protein A4U43_C02F16740 [Asparagus officinalis]
MAPRAKASDAKRARSDASPSVPISDCDPEFKPLNFVLDDFKLALRCSMRLVDLELLLTKLEDLQHTNLESEVKLFLAPVRRHAVWLQEYRRRDIEDKGALIDHLDLRHRLL